MQQDGRFITTNGMTIRTIVFDFGNVLGFFSHRRAMEQLLAYSQGVNADTIQSLFVDGKLEDDYERGAIDSAAFRALVCERCRLTCGDAQFDAAYADMFTPNPETCNLVPKLKRHHRLVLLSNTTEVHSRWFRRQFADVLAHFDSMVLSFEIGIRKPDRAIYEHCLTVAGCAASECLFLDDIPVNVEAARACGWDGIVYRPDDGLTERLAALGVFV